MVERPSETPKGLPTKCISVVVARVRAAASLYQRFCCNQSGGLATWFAIMLVPLLFFAGAGLDLARSVNQQSQMQGATDAAALAGAGTYTSVTNVVAATAAATAYMNNFKTASGLSALSFTVTPGTVTSGASVTLYKMSVTATATINNTLMTMAKGSNSMSVTATAQNPVYNITISAANFNSSAVDLNTISYYIVPSDNSVPLLASTTLLYSNAATINTGNVTIQLTASQKIGFLLTNTTGGRPITTCITILFLQSCTTKTNGYGSNQYGGAQGSTHYIYSHLYPPSKIAYPTNPTNNCSLQVLTSSASPVSGACSNTLPANAAVNCVQASGQTLYFNWNDMGGSTDDRDYNDAQYSVTCSKVDSTTSKGLILTN